MVAPSIPVTSLCAVSPDSMTQYGSCDMALKPEYRRGQLRFKQGGKSPPMEGGPVCAVYVVPNQCA
jgi:hypothetical protein